MMKKIDKNSIIKEYLIRFLRLWLFWFWFVALDIVSFIVDIFVLNFPRWIYLVIAGSGFIVVNIKMFADQENRIRELTAGKVDTLKAVIQEIESNRKKAQENAQIRGNASFPGSLSFMQFCSSRCQGTLLSGELKLKDPLLKSARQYKDRMEQVNTLIESVKASTERFQSADGYANTIRKICSESLPNVMNDLQGLIEQEITSSQSNKI